MNKNKIKYINQLLLNSYLYEKLLIGTIDNKYKIDYSKLNEIDKNNLFDIINNIPNILKFTINSKNKQIII